MWIVRLYIEGDERGIFNLMRPEYGMSSRHQSHWFWEHKHNPFGGSLIGVAEHNGQIVGHLSFVPLKMKIGENVAVASHGVELIVHSDFRRRGIFSAMEELLLGEAEKKGILITYSFPTQPVRKGHLKYGFFDVCNVLVLVKCFDAYNALIQKYPIFRKGKFFLRFVLRTFDFIFRASSETRKMPVIESLRIAEISSFDDHINDFWDSVSKDYEILLVRDKEYLNWRYFEKPDQDYKVLLAEKNGRVLGYIVLGCREVGNLKEGCIVDMLAGFNETNVIQCLISKAIEYFVEEKVDFITCWTLRHSLLYKILKDNGFICSRSKHTLTARLNSPVLSEKFVKDPRNWYLSMGDSDLI